MNLDPDSATLPAPLPDERQRRRALLIVFLVVFIDLLGFGIVLPLLPRYAKTFLQGIMPGGPSSVLSGLTIGVLYSSFSLMQFIFAPIWGRISDRTGRRPILLMGLFGSVVFYALFGFGSDLGSSQHPLWGLALLFLARTGAGIAGATIATAQAVIADTTTPDKRSRGMALIGAAFGIGFCFGPLLGAGAVALWPHFLGGPAYLAVGLSLVAFLLGVRLLPETLRANSPAPHRGWLSMRALRDTLRMPTIGLLVTTFFLATFGFANFEATLSLLTLEAFHFTEESNFLAFAYVGLVLMLAQGLLYRRLAGRVTEVTFLRIGVALMLVGLANLAGIAALSRTTAPETGSVIASPLFAWFLATLAVAVTGFAFVNPSVQSLISRRTDPAQQGEVLGVNQSASALARILGPVVGLGLFNRTENHILPYLVASALLLSVLVLTPRIRAA